MGYQYLCLKKIELLTRKMNRTTFLDLRIDSLINKIDDQDEK